MDAGGVGKQWLRHLEVWCTIATSVAPLIAHNSSSEIVVERIAAPSPGEFERRFRRASVPVVLTDVASRWKAYGLWSHDYFREAWAQERVPVLPTRGRVGQYNPQIGYEFPEMPMAEAIDRLAQGGRESVYVMVPLDRYMQSLLDDVDVPVYCKGHPGFRSRLWVSGYDIGVRLHREFSENLIGQVSGVKELTIYPPEEWHHLYAFPNGVPVPTFCQVDLEDGEPPDPARFPRYAQARRAVVALQPGEMLFLPSRWWHHSRTIEPSVTITFWWAAGVYEKMIRVAQRMGLSPSV